MNSFIKKLILSGLVVVCLMSPALSIFAQNEKYIPLEPIAGLNTDPGPDKLGSYIQGLFRILIGVAGMLAVLMISIGGFQYMSTDAVYGKSEAKERITYAIGGLLLAIVSWLILNTINPELLKTDLNVPVTEGRVSTAPAYTKVCFAARVYKQPSQIGLDESICGDWYYVNPDDVLAKTDCMLVREDRIKSDPDIKFKTSCNIREVDETGYDEVRYCSLYLSLDLNPTEFCYPIQNGDEAAAKSLCENAAQSKIDAGTIRDATIHCIPQ